MKPEHLIALAGLVVPIVVAFFAYKSATRANRITAEFADRGKLTDDLQEEVARLRQNMADATAQADNLRFKLRLLSDFAEACVAKLRQNNLEPPPVPAAVRRPWEEP